MLFPQVRLKQYAGLHVDTLVVPVVCIRVSFAIKKMKIFIQKWGLFRFVSKIDLKTNEYPTIHKFRSDDSLHMPDDIHIALYPFQCTVKFSFCGDYHVSRFSNKYPNELSDLSLLLENQNQSLRNAFSLPFHTQSVKQGAKLRLS